MSSFPDEQRQEVLRLRAQWEEMGGRLDRLGEQLSDQFKTMTGPALSEMLESREATERYLDNLDPKLRCAALCLITNHWGANQQFADKCESIVQQDADQEVRGVALSCLGSYYSGSSDRRIGQLLADKVSDETEPEMVRQAAYLALFEFRKLPIDSWPRLSSFRFPADVDWFFVAAFSQR